MSVGELLIAALLVAAYADVARRIAKRDRAWRAEWMGALAEVRSGVDAAREEAGASRRASDAATAGVRRFETMFERTADAVRKSHHDG